MKEAEKVFSKLNRPIKKEVKEFMDRLYSRHKE